MVDISSQLPSNRRFGLFFSALLLGVGVFVALKGQGAAAGSMVVLAAGLGLVSALRPSWLFPLNRAWAALGYRLGTIVSPVVLGVLYFALVTPLALALRLSGRDALLLRVGQRKSHWQDPDGMAAPEGFRRQY